MNDLIEHILPLLQIFKTSSKVDEFQKWLKKEHGKDLDNPLFHGYKFFLETAFSSFFYYLAYDKTFRLKESFLFKCTLGRTFYIDKLPASGKDSCEKIIFLKNIYSFYKPVLKSKNTENLKTSIKLFQENVSNRFLQIIEPAIVLKSKSKITYNECIRLLLIDNLYILFTQINNNGPTGFNGTLLKNYWIKEEKLKSVFEGYKYALQFIWCKVLGEHDYRKSSLIHLHKADSWRKYKTYNIARKNASPFKKMFGERFNLEEQTSLDSYFYRVKAEIVLPIEEKHELNILQMENLFKVHLPKEIFKRKVFGELFSVTKAKKTTEKLTVDENIEIQLYWYPVEIIDSRRTQMHNSVPAFITALAGTVALRKKESEFKKVAVCKIVSSAGKKKNNYSYGILIDAKAAAGHYYSGWLLYYDCCGDYSGFSGSEHREAEKIIKKYLRMGVVELRELRVKKPDLKKYISKHTNSAETINSKPDEKENERQKTNKLNQGKYDELRGLVFELLCYYFAHDYYGNKGYRVSWGGLKAGSIDLTLELNDKIIIVECKLNIDTCNWDDLTKSINQRISRFKDKNVDCEFWVWYEPVTYREALREFKKDVKVFSTGRREKIRFLNPINLKKIKELLDFRFG